MAFGTAWGLGDLAYQHLMLADRCEYNSLRHVGCSHLVSRCRGDAGEHRGDRLRERMIAERLDRDPDLQSGSADAIRCAGFVTTALNEFAQGAEEKAAAAGQVDLSAAARPNVKHPAIPAKALRGAVIAGGGGKCGERKQWTRAESTFPRIPLAVRPR